MYEHPVTLGKYTLHVFFFFMLYVYSFHFNEICGELNSKWHIHII